MTLIRALVSTALLALAVGGCSFAPQVANNSVDYNKALEESSNELLLLNIARAAHGYPLYFTALVQVRGAFSNSYGITAGGGVGQDAADVLTLGGSANLVSSPSFDVAVLDSQDFIRGTLTPVPPALFAYFWNAGWPKELLIYLLIDKIEIFDKDQVVVKSISNEPDDEEAWNDFVNTINILNLNLKSERKTLEVGPPLSADKVGHLNDLSELVSRGMTIKSGSEMIPSTGEYSLSIPYLGVTFETHLPPGGVPDKIEEVREASPTKQFSLTIDGQINASPQSENAEPASIKPTNSGRVYLRSTQSVIYHLGLLVRHENNSGHPRTVKTENCTEQVLFSARTGSAVDGTGAVRVEHLGQVFEIPSWTGSSCGDGPGYSMLALSLVNQLIGLNKTAKDLPTTSAVTVVGN